MPHSLCFVLQEWQKRRKKRPRSNWRHSTRPTMNSPNIVQIRQLLQKRLGHISPPEWFAFVSYDVLGNSATWCSAAWLTFFLLSLVQCEQLSFASLFVFSDTGSLGTENKIHTIEAQKIWVCCKHALLRPALIWHVTIINVLDLKSQLDNWYDT